MNDEPEVRVGQVWADNDKRSAGRHVLVTEVLPDKIVVVPCTASGEQTGGRYTKISRSRLRPTSTGYRLVKDAP